MSEQLSKLSDRLGAPSVDKLFIAAKQRGLNVTKKQVRDFSRRQGERQIYRPVQKSEGKTASETIDSRFQMDLIDLHNDAAFDKSTGGVNKFILILINLARQNVSNLTSSGTRQAMRHHLDLPKISNAT